MSVQIVLEFVNEEAKDYFCGQMSDGFGEGLPIDFSFSKQKEGTDGTKQEHYERLKDESGKEIYFVKVHKDEHEFCEVCGDCVNCFGEDECLEGGSHFISKE